MAGEEMLERGVSCFVVWVDISITANVRRDSRLGLGEGDHHNVQCCKGREEVLITATCGKVDADMQGGGQPRDREEEG